MCCHRRGSDTFICEGEILIWPRCEINNCANYICIGMSNSLCYPHGIEFGAFTEAEFEADRKRKNAN